jgi:transposase
MNDQRLNASQKRQLTAIVRRTHDTRQYRRALAVLECDAGKSVAQIAQVLRVSRQSVYNWIEGFWQTGDAQALSDAPRSGRPACWSERVDALLQALLQDTPQHLGYFSTQWTVPLLQEQLRHSTGQCYCSRTIRRSLYRLDYVWKRPRYVLLG